MQKVQTRENQDPDSLNILAEKPMNNCESAVPQEGPQESLNCESGLLS